METVASRSRWPRSSPLDADHAVISRPAASLPPGIALHDAGLAERIALCGPLPLPGAGGEDAAPKWIHLLPGGGAIVTNDGRGPYTIADAAELARVSLAAAGGRLPIDENHAIDHQSAKGGPSPARGWIVALETREGGIWGRVEWTKAGRELVSDRAYRAISPVFLHTPDNRVVRLLRAALTNMPNLRGLTALHERDTTMDELLKKLLAALGLKEDADEATALQAVETLKAATATAVQAALKPIATAAGLKDDAEATAVADAVTRLAAGTTGEDKDKVITALQAEVTSLADQLKALKDTTNRAAAEAVVDAAIAAGKPGVKPLRDHYIARHMVDPQAVAKELDGLPSLTQPSGARPAAPPKRDKDGKLVVSLNAEQKAAAKVLGIPEDKYAETLAAEAAAEEDAA